MFLLKINCVKKKIVAEFDIKSSVLLPHSVLYH